MRLLALVLSRRGFLAFNENLNHFMLRPGSMPAIARHIAWRGANALRWSVAHGSQNGLGAGWRNTPPRVLRESGAANPGCRRLAGRYRAAP